MSSTMAPVTTNQAAMINKESIKLSEADRDLLDAVKRHNSADVQHALRNGAAVDCTRFGETSLMRACSRESDAIVRILLDAGADSWRQDIHGWSGIGHACANGHLSTVQILLNHDNSLLEFVNIFGQTPLLAAFEYRQFELAHLLLDRGANVLATTTGGETALLLACGRRADLRLVRRLLAACVPVEARDSLHRTALYYAAMRCNTAVVRELIVEHNANIFAADEYGKTPFDGATHSNSADGKHAFLIECYSNKMTQEHGRLALHAVLRAAEYSFAEAYFGFHPPQNPLRIHLPLGRLTLQHFRTLLSILDAELIRNRDESGTLPIHMACRNKAPVEVVAMLVEMDSTTLQLADYSGALPIHLLHYGANSAEYASVRYLVEHGGVGTLAARNKDGAMPLHALCGSTYPSLRTVQYLIQSFPGSVAAQTNDGQYPFMIAACASSKASLSVVYELVRTNPDLIIPR